MIVNLYRLNFVQICGGNLNLNLPKKFTLRGKQRKTCLGVDMYNSLAQAVHRQIWAGKWTRIVEIVSHNNSQTIGLIEHMEELCKRPAVIVICVQRTCCRLQKYRLASTISNQFVTKLTASKNQHYCTKYEISCSRHRFRYRGFQFMTGLSVSYWPIPTSYRPFVPIAFEIRTTALKLKGGIAHPAHGPAAEGAFTEYFNSLFWPLMVQV